MRLNKITPCLWFDHEGEEAAKFYTGIFKNSKMGRLLRYGEAGQETHRRPVGSVLTQEFEIEGQSFVVLNGGPDFKFNEAISFQIICDDQKEVDYYWNELGRGGDPKAQQCGWLKDKYGVSWQVVPKVMLDLLNDPDHGKSQRAMQAMMGMKKIEIQEVERAAKG